MTRPASPPPVGRGWREGDEPGRRSFLRLDAPLDLEFGDQLPAAVLAYETWGTLNARRDNAVLVLHALTGDSHLAGPAGPGHPAAGWWDALVGPGRALDTEQWFVIAPNVLGGCQGTTGPSSAAPDGRPWGSRFPRITIRDQVEAESRFADALGIRRWAAVIGGSMGGMRALEWAVGHPDRVASLLVLAVGAYATADQIGLQSAQIQAVRTDRAFNGGDYYDATPGSGPLAGLGLARRIAHLSYRSENEMAQRFGRDPQDGEDPLDGGRYAIQSYLDHHAGKLARRFDANSYIVLTEAMNHHDIGRGRGGIETALGRITAPTVVGGIDSDRLYPPYLQEELAKLIPGADGPHFVHSAYGHDAFLIETDQVADLVKRTLRRAEENMTLRHVRGGQLSGDTNQTTGMTRHEAISGKTVGSTKVWMGQTHVAPFSNSGDHHHGEAETAIYVVSGNPVFVFAEGEKEVRIETEPGDYVFVPPYVPHREENPGEHEAVVVIARSSQEGIVVNLPSLWESVDRD